MKKLLLPLLFFACLSPLLAQMNATLVGNLDFDDAVNDIWGYVAPDGTEYALVGLNGGIATVSLADPANPVLVSTVELPNVTWRDMKTYGEYAYATADGRNASGITVLDFTGLPTTVTSETYTYAVPGTQVPLTKAHNLYIDTVRGLAFTAGGDGNVNRGGVLVFDLVANPAHPPLIAQGPAIYAHDVYVQDTLMYTSEIYGGQLGIYSVNDLDSIFRVGSTPTPFAFTHNAWTTASGTTVFTTDERANASVAAYDISDLGDIKLLDEYRPLTSLNTNTIPHNVHVIDEYLSVSYYTDGLRVVDASVPDNLVEIANYDTYGGPDGGFNGAWGAFPFLPSGLTLVSDRQSGLFVVDVDYKRAARIAGRVDGAQSGSPILGARVEILSDQANMDRTTTTGEYATGIADAGRYQVVASAVGYYPDTVEVTLESGVSISQDFALTRRRVSQAEVRVVGEDDLQPVIGAEVSFTHRDTSYVTITDSAGLARFEGLYDYHYLATITAWGYQLEFLDNLAADNLGESDTIFLTDGYEDTFTTDLGWTVSGDARRGEFERGTPEQTFNTNGPGQPNSDSPRDVGDQGYFTGLRGGNSMSNDVDGGTPTLTSPIIDLTAYGSGTLLTYDFWYSNIAGTNPSDSMTVSISNGDTSQLLSIHRGELYQWNRDTVYLDGMLEFTDSMRLIVSVSDTENDNLVEAGFDNFRILDSVMLSPVTVTQEEPAISASAYPNPTNTAFNLAYDLGSYQSAEVEVFSLTGQRVLQQRLDATTGQVSIGGDWKVGVYLVRISAQDGRPLSVLKLVKF